MSSWAKSKFCGSKPLAEQAKPRRKAPQGSRYGLHRLAMLNEYFLFFCFNLTKLERKITFPSGEAGTLLPTSWEVGGWGVRFACESATPKVAKKSTKEANQNFHSLPISSPLATPTPWVGLLIRLSLCEIHLPRWGRSGFGANISNAIGVSPWNIKNIFLIWIRSNNIESEYESLPLEGKVAPIGDGWGVAVRRRRYPLCETVRNIHSTS